MMGIVVASLFSDQRTVLTFKIALFLSMKILNSSIHAVNLMRMRTHGARQKHLYVFVSFHLNWHLILVCWLGVKI